MPNYSAHHALPQLQHNSAAEVLPQPLSHSMPLKLCQKLLNNSVSEVLRQPCSLKCKRLHACQIASEAEWLSSSWENNDCGRTSAAEWLSGRGPSLCGVGFE